MATKTITRYRTRFARPKHRKKAGFTIPVAAVAGFLPLLNYAYLGYKGWPENRLYGMMTELVYYATGYHQRLRIWNPGDGMVKGIGPIVMGLLVHKVIGQKLGLNRVLKSAGIPIIRI